MKVGDRVTVKTSVIVYVHPEHRNQKFDVQGLSGNIVSIMTDWQGRPISPNLPIVVDFGNKFKAHFREDELELIQ
jgi:hypothetical protein